MGSETVLAIARVRLNGWGGGGGAWGGWGAGSGERGGAFHHAFDPPPCPSTRGRDLDGWNVPSQRDAAGNGRVV